jgi:hypothetical protein
MATAASQFLTEVAADLVDAGLVTWTLAELVRYTNAGEMTICTVRQDLAAVEAPLILASGVSQSLPDGAMALIDIPRNTGGDAVRWIDRGVMDRFHPGWTQDEAAAVIKHIVTDARTPRRFMVWPPANGSASLDVIYAAEPTPFAIPNDNVISGVGGNLHIPDTVVPALRHYVLSRAFARDGEDTLNLQRADRELNLCATALGIEAAVLKGNAPAQDKDSSTRRGRGA